MKLCLPSRWAHRAFRAALSLSAVAMEFQAKVEKGRTSASKGQLFRGQHHSYVEKKEQAPFPSSLLEVGRGSNR